MKPTAVTYYRAGRARRALTPQEARLAGEIDGASHDHPDQVAHDRRRTGWLATQGIEVLRFPALSIRDDLDGVLVVIRAAALARSSG